MLKKMENNVGARTHLCLTPMEIGKLLNLLMILLKDMSGNVSNSKRAPV